MKKSFIRSIIVVLINIFTFSLPYSADFTDNPSLQQFAQLQLFKKKNSYDLQNTISEMYELRSEGKNQSAFELGSGIIRHVKRIEGNKLISIIALLTTESASEIKMPVDTLLKYLKYYKKAEGGFNRPGKALVMQILYTLVGDDDCTKVNYFIKGVIELDKNALSFLLTTTFDQLVKDKKYKNTVNFLKCIYPDYRILFLESLEEQLSNELKDSLEIDKLDEKTLESINQLSNISPDIRSKLTDLLSLKSILKGNYEFAEKLLLTSQERITQIVIILGYEYAINNKWENFQPFFRAVKGTKTEVSYLKGYISLKSENYTIVKNIVLSDPVRFDSLGFDFITELISLQKYKEAEEIIASDPVTFQKQGIDLINKYIELKEYEDAERIILSDPATFKDRNIQLAVIYLRERQYSQAERLFLAVKDFLDYKNGLYLLITQINLYSYNTALDEFRKLFPIFGQNSSDAEILWEKIARMFIGETFPLEITEYTSSITNISERRRAMCIANYYIGLKFFSEGNKTTATQYFSQAVSTDMKDLFEYELAAGMLENRVDLNEAIAGDRKTIAVMDFEANGLSDAEARILTNRLTANLIRRDAFIVLERAKMDEILKEQGFQQSGCVSNECVVEVGQLLGMQLMLTGSVGRFGSINIIEARIIDVETGKIVKSATFDIEGAKEILLTTGINGVLNQLLK